MGKVLGASRCLEQQSQETNANNNSLIGCTLCQNPFAYYNVIAGNVGNGVSITSANNVTVQANFLGIGADNTTMIPNHGNGLLVAGTSQNTQVGGVIPRNKRYGIAVMDRAYNNSIFHSTIGSGALTGAIPNLNGGILLGSGTSATTIGGPAVPFHNAIQSNDDAGLFIDNSNQNIVENNAINSNTLVGVYAVGVCTGTVISSNTILGNGVIVPNNVDISQATGITFMP